MVLHEKGLEAIRRQGGAPGLAVYLAPSQAAAPVEAVEQEDEANLARAVPQCLLLLKPCHVLKSDQTGIRSFRYSPNIHRRPFSSLCIDVVQMASQSSPGLRSRRKVTEVRTPGGSSRPWYLKPKQGVSLAGLGYHWKDCRPVGARLDPVFPFPPDLPREDVD